jgi:hypothetical protein
LNGADIEKRAGGDCNELVVERGEVLRESRDRDRFRAIGETGDGRDDESDERSVQRE